MRVLKLYKRRFDTRNTQRGLRADMIPFAVHWRPKLRCFDGEIYVNLSTMKVQMASARKIRTGCLLDAWAFVLTQEPYSAGTVRVQPGPPEDAVPLENPVTAGNAPAEYLHPHYQFHIPWCTIAVSKPSKKEQRVQTGQASGVGMLAIDASRVAPDYSYSAVVPRGAQVFAVGWNAEVGVLLMYSAVPTGPEEILVDEVVRLWFVPLESTEACAPVGAAYLGTVRVASDVAMCVFLELDRE